MFKWLKKRIGSKAFNECCDKGYDRIGDIFLEGEESCFFCQDYENCSLLYLIKKRREYRKMPSIRQEPVEDDFVASLLLEPVVGDPVGDDGKGIAMVKKIVILTRNPERQKKIIDKKVARLTRRDCRVYSVVSSYPRFLWIIAYFS